MAYVAERQGEGAGASIHFLHQSAPVSEQAAVHFAFRIENFQHIRQAYGEDIARQALGEAHRLLVQIVRADGVVVPEPCGSIDVLISKASIFSGPSMAARCREWLDAVCRFVPMMVVETTLGSICLWIGGRWELLTDGAPRGSDRGGSGGGSFSFLGDPPREGTAWAEQYRSDMAQVAKVLSAISDEMSVIDSVNGSVLYWQAVRDARAPSSILYHEALFRLIGPNGGAQSPEPLFLALERLGFVRLVDHHVLSRVIDELDAAPHVRLAANISARSVGSDSLWDETKARLRRSPDAARRLVIEITETAALPNVSNAVRCVTELRRLGCTIALDDFGSGFASVRQLLALSPDVVKIDRQFLRRSAMGDRQRETFRHLVGLARSLGADVVAEGVETGAQAELAIEAGATWHQGYHWGEPSSSRLWRVVPGSTDIGAGSASHCSGEILESESRRRLP